MQFVSTRKVDWKHLGLELGLGPTTLEQIEMNYQDDLFQCTRDMLTAWLLQRDNVSQIGATSWSCLKSALEETGEKKILTGMIDRFKVCYKNNIIDLYRTKSEHAYKSSKKRLC